MKTIKSKIIILLLVIVFITSGCINDSSMDETETGLELETISTHGFYISFDNESALFDNADIVVIAKANKNFEEREHYLEYATDIEPHALVGFYSTTPAKIKEVIKNNKNSTFDKNDTIMLMEPVAIIEQNNVKKKITIDDYIEINNNDTYLLYLKEAENGAYAVINMNNGRFNLDVEEKINGNMEIKEKHMKIKNEAVKRHKIQTENLK